MGISKSKIFLKIIGIVLEILGIIGAFAVPLIFTIILPISKAVEHYNTIPDDGIGMIVKTVLIVVFLSPLLFVVIFFGLFIPGSILFTIGNGDFKKKEEQQQPQIMPMPMRDPRDDFYIVKEDNPNRSDAGIAQMNWIMAQKKKEEEENNEHTDESLHT